MLYDYLYQTYGVNTPIFTCEIQYKDYSDSWLYSALKELCEKGTIIKYDRGIYYIPTKTIFGNSHLSFDEVIEKKYIQDHGKIFGFYGGIGLLNGVGLSTQVPATPTIITNVETSRKRIVEVAGNRVILKKPRVEVNSENVYAMTFLEIVTSIPEYYLEDEWRKECIIEYMNVRKIKRKDVTSLINVYPELTSKKLLESELIFYAA